MGVSRLSDLLHWSVHSFFAGMELSWLLKLSSKSYSQEVSVLHLTWLMLTILHLLPLHICFRINNYKITCWDFGWNHTGSTDQVEKNWHLDSINPDLSVICLVRCNLIYVLLASHEMSKLQKLRFREAGWEMVETGFGRQFAKPQRPCSEPVSNPVLWSALGSGIWGQTGRAESWLWHLLDIQPGV